ncbi:hypothetical protein G6F46_012446 [Rhizopus delemar]|uniref:C2H2-type domain-containing protein n=2 Tax=Rhizopus TaxID=4842 RepID=A0A9P6YQC8_9FUNG|nr:hypothetical protein G6F55_012567 [Rhizopus delemar]KAG1552407.1 hypothetical protein G6F51_001239 [Rhizopus arrhizus]KAG1487450.1 hypothetical protein G6F54_012651 [Rhizopus delemar]KAG1490809.1 hypothetical protein G6F52_013561 [Rhizopus delemar]KAG1495253.1 hypothetical protein G6F53_012406 [Rhizopus delemar]
MTEPLAINEQSSHPAAPTRTKRFVCINPNCTMQFDRAEHLARHERKHTGEKPFECREPTCYKRFSRYDNMMQHTKTHIDNKKNKTRGRKRKQRRPAHVSPSTSEIDPTTPPVVDDFRARRVLSIQELCHPSNEEIMVSAARYISRSDLQAIGILVFMSREA